MRVSLSAIRGMLRSISTKRQLNNIGQEGEDFLKGKAASLYTHGGCACDVCKQKRVDSIPEYLVSCYQPKIIALLTVMKDMQDIQNLAYIEGRLQPKNLSDLIWAIGKLDALLDKFNPPKSEILDGALSDPATTHWKR
jgi:hypothetical protein